jgi:integrase
MTNRAGHRRFGNIRKRESGRYQIRYPGPDGEMRAGEETYARKGDAETALVMIEAQIRAGQWTDPDRGKVKLGDYALAWIEQRPGLRPRTSDLYKWLLRKHIAPHLGGVPLGKLSTQLIREWRAKLLRNGVSVSVAAKAYRLLRAVLMTAVEEDKILPENPCRIRGAGDEKPDERPVLTVAQVFELAKVIGRRPVGNVRKLPDGGYQLRFRRHGEMRTSPEVYTSRTDAQRAVWTMAADGRADYTYDRRYRALVLLATFASLRWGEATALRRCDLDLPGRAVRVRAAYVERSTGEMLIGPPKSHAGRRVVGIPEAIVPALQEHLAVFVQDDPGALVFPGQKGGPLRRGNFNKLSGWPDVVRVLGVPGLHFHDLRHTGNQFAANSGAALKDLMARMGHDSERAALIYQHEARGADKRITGAIDAHVQAERDGGEDDDGSAGVLVPAG